MCWVKEVKWRPQQSVLRVAGVIRFQAKHRALCTHSQQLNCGQREEGKYSRLVARTQTINLLLQNKTGFFSFFFFSVVLWFSQ